MTIQEAIKSGKDFKLPDIPEWLYVNEHGIIWSRETDMPIALNEQKILSNEWITKEELTPEQMKLIIIEFMKAKNDLIKSYLSIDNYFTDNDAFNITNWSDEDVKHVFEILDMYIQSEQYNGLSNQFCPFCIYTNPILQTYLNCGKCLYSKAHGICGAQGSFYNVIYQLFKRKKLSLQNIFNTTWYKQTWEKCKNIHTNQTKGGNNE